jgi:hypothetical protein
MRSVFPGLVAALVALPLSAEPFSHVSQATATLATTYTRTGDFAKTETKRSDEDYRVTFGVSGVRFGNSELLDVLVFNEVISEKKGWELVGVWADWGGEGASSYRFFVRKKVSGVYETVAVPAELLGLEILQPYVAKTIRTREGEILSGTERFKAYSRLTVGDDPRDPSDEEKPVATRRINPSAPLGMFSGSGRYDRPGSATTAIYLPNNVVFNGYGISEDGADVVGSTLRMATSKAMLSAQYPGFTSENPSLGPDSTAIQEP